MVLEISDLVPIETASIQTRFRCIRTAIPVPESVEAIKRLRAVEPQSMAGMPPIIWDQAQGFLVRDRFGNQWIDLSSGIVLANVGHAHPRILDAIRKQLDAGLIYTYAYPNDLRRQLLERLVELALPALKKAIVFSAGTEATECAISLMRKHGFSLSAEKVGILSFEQSYHGRTLSARMAGGPPGLIDGLRRESVFQFQLPRPGSPESNGFEADLKARQIDPTKIAGIIFESIPGWTTTLYPREYVSALMRWAASHYILVTADEVQAGMGRTGRWFAFEHYGITPDLIACGKGLTSSLPVSAVIGRREIMDLAGPGEMSSTFGGNPVCVAAALANLDVLRDEKLVEKSDSLGKQLGEMLAAVAQRHQPYVRCLNGQGLFYSIHLKDPVTGESLNDLCDEIAMECIRRGVMLFVTGRGFLKIVPPLTIDPDALFEAVGVIREAMDQFLT
jgi:4-aminobutyrate aminotransferase/(S)-3-amino-2-methylpropionate transaminase